MLSSTNMKIPNTMVWPNCSSCRIDGYRTLVSKKISPAYTCMFNTHKNTFFQSCYSSKYAFKI